MLYRRGDLKLGPEHSNQKMGGLPRPASPMPWSLENCWGLLLASLALGSERDCLKGIEYRAIERDT